MTAKRIIFWLLLTAFVITGLFWALFIPFRAERLYSAVPDDAVFVSHHVRLSDRWTLISDNPLLSRIADALDAEDDEIRSILVDPKLAKNLHRFMGRETVISYSHPHTETLADTLTVVSWVGVYGQFMRWGFLKGALSDFEATRWSDGSRIWQYHDESLGDLTLSLSVFEGVAAACLSRDPFAAARTRRRMAAGAPVVVPLNPALAPPPVAGTEEALDLFWIRNRMGPWASGGGISKWSPTKIAAIVRHPSPLLPGGYLNDGVAERVGRLVGDVPASVVLTSWQDVETGLQRLKGAASYRAVYDAIRTIVPADAPMFMALLTGPYSGRVMRLRVPSLVFGLQVAPSTATVSQLAVLLDALNATFDLGVIPKQQERGATPFIMLDTIRSGGLGLMSEDERPALAVVGDWLLLGSNARVLEKLIAHRNDADNRRRAMAQWLSHFPSSGTSAFAWCHTADTAEALTNIKAVAAMAMMLNDARKYARIRNAFDDAQKWIDLLGAVGEISVTTSNDGESLRSEVRMDLAAPHDSL